jgi:hypothetical protein
MALNVTHSSSVYDPCSVCNIKSISQSVLLESDLHPKYIKRVSEEAIILLWLSQSE